eukprot:Pgem_evm13s12025
MTCSGSCQGCYATAANIHENRLMAPVRPMASSLVVPVYGSANERAACKPMLMVIVVSNMHNDHVLAKFEPKNKNVCIING